MKLFYRNMGSGQPLIILHGVFGLSDNWMVLGKQLAHKYNVFIPDQRNHGNSPHSNIFNYNALTEDLIKFIKNKQLNNPIIIGHSMGGKVAMKFALDYPDLVSKLIVIDISPKLYYKNQNILQMVKAMDSINFREISNRKDILKQLTNITDSGLQNLIIKNIKRVEKNTYKWKINFNVIKNCLNSLMVEISAENCFTKPILFIRGGLSDYISVNDYDLIKKIFPNSNITTIHNASHWVHVDTPEELYKSIIEYLEY